MEIKFEVINEKEVGGGHYRRNTKTVTLEGDTLSEIGNQALSLIHHLDGYSPDCKITSASIRYSEGIFGGKGGVSFEFTLWTPNADGDLVPSDKVIWGHCDKSELDTLEKVPVFTRTKSNLKELREKNNLTQAQLAEVTGIPLMTISKYENGTRSIAGASLTVAIKLARALNCDPQDLI